MRSLACRMPSESAVWSPKRSRSRPTRSIRRREAIARMAFTWEAVAGRGLGWLWMRWAGLRWLAVTVAPWMAGLVRTSMISWACAWLTGWDAREGAWLRVCDPFVVWGSAEKGLGAVGAGRGREILDAGLAGGGVGGAVMDRAVLARAVVALEPGDLVLDGLLARLVRAPDDHLEALGVVQERAVEFGLNGATGRGAGEARQADFLGDARVELEHVVVVLL